MIILIWYILMILKKFYTYKSNIYIEYWENYYNEWLKYSCDFVIWI